MSDQAKVNATLVDALGSALRSGDHGLKTVPGLLKRVLREESWREFVTQRGELVKHQDFATFVTAAPLKGIGADIALVRRIIADDAEAVDLLDRALQNPVGSNLPVSNRHEQRPAGTTEAAALRRLRKDAPELHADVIAGRLSAHGAMVQAGYRPKTVSVPVARPESIARKLREYMSPDDLARLIRLLMRPETDTNTGD